MPCGCKHKRKKKKGSGMYIRGGNIGGNPKTWTPKYLINRFKPGSGMGFSGSGMSFRGGGMGFSGAGLRGKRVSSRRGTGRRII